VELPGSGDILSRLHPGLAGLVRAKGWSGLQPVQRAAAPVILAGADAVIEAPTAGGKTEAVLFPALTLAAEDKGQGEGVRLLYLAPLRALLNDLERRAKEYSEACGLHAFKWHGDVEAARKLAELRDPPELLLTTPESLEAILLRRAERQRFFASLHTVILDEAHNFAAGDRGGHLVCLLERLGRYVARPLQRIAVTATIGNPEELLRWLGGSGSRRESVRVEGARPPQDWRILHFLGEEAELDQIAELHHGLPGRRSLIFVRSRRRAEEVVKQLAAHDELSARPLQVRTHHGSVSKYYREEAERMIRIASEDGIDAILSTATLELGIDLGELDRVYQMGAVASPSALLQRAGRTGRRAGRTQFLRGLTAVPEELPILAATFELALERRPEALRFPGRAFHLLAHQLLCLSLESHGVDPRAGWELLRQADCFRGIRKPEVGELVKYMVEKGYFRVADDKLVPGDQAEKELLPGNWRRLFAVFESVPLYDVMHQRQQVGTLDAGFAASLEAPFLFVLAGHLWSADRIDHDARTIDASHARAGIIPKWKAFGGPDVPFETAQRVGAMLHGPAAERPFLDREAAQAIEHERRQVAHLDWRPGALLRTSTGAGQLTLTTYAGDRINRTLERLLEAQGLDCKFSYREVIVATAADAGQLAAKVGQCMERVSGGELGEVAALEAELAASLKPWRFSPFVRCLPPHLAAAALAEQALDAPGLIRYLKGAAAG
jgi:ATP-dependent helicase Lhr and Lhr-like helicase